MSPYEAELHRFIPYVIHRDRQTIHSFKSNKGFVQNAMYNFGKLSPLVQASILKNKPSISFCAVDFNQSINRELYLASGERGVFTCNVIKQVPIPNVGVIVQVQFSPIVEHTNSNNRYYTFITHNKSEEFRTAFFFNADCTGAGEGTHYEIAITDKEQMVLNEVRKIRNETALKVNKFKLEHLMDSKLNQLLEG